MLFTCTIVIALVADKPKQRSFQIYGKFRWPEDTYYMVK